MRHVPVLLKETVELLNLKAGDNVVDCTLGEDEDTIIELARDYMNWIYHTLEKEREYENADAQVDEAIRANEYEFLKDGTYA